MPDITMCLNEQCKNKETCLRYKALPSIFQSYSNFECSDENDWMYYYQIPLIKK